MLINISLFAAFTSPNQRPEPSTTAATTTAAAATGSADTMQRVSHRGGALTPSPAVTLRRCAARLCMCVLCVRWATHNVDMLAARPQKYRKERQTDRQIR